MVISGSQGQLSHGKTVWQRLFMFSPDRTLSPLTWESGTFLEMAMFIVVYFICVPDGCQHQLNLDSCPNYGNS